MDGGKRVWHIIEDTDFIGSTIPDDALVGYYEFTDGVLLLCSATEDSSGDSDCPMNSLESEAASDSWDDYDDIPF